MISLGGLTEHTLTGYCTYIRAYLNYLSNVLHKSPEDISWQELRGYIKWLQHSRNLSDRTINCAISQLRFFTLYVLHKLRAVYLLYKLFFFVAALNMILSLRIITKNPGKNFARIGQFMVL
ncbi:MAG: phage integrase N-terminal SAM-like domain-containing protein [Roseburia sp.]|nr:phage integrase N-terminal SAM-like domain-containing protein [Roseburia sp.]